MNEVRGHQMNHVQGPHDLGHKRHGNQRRSHQKRKRPEDVRAHAADEHCQWALFLREMFGDRGNRHHVVHGKQHLDNGHREQRRPLFFNFVPLNHKDENLTDSSPKRTFT
jgi:hypothetical protein